MKIDHPMSARRVAAITAALASQALSARDLAPLVFLSVEQTRRYLVQMHLDGAVRIARWAVQATGRETRLPAYRAGAGRDAPRPAVLTSAQRQIKHVARVRRDEDRYELHKARNRARKLKTVRDPLVAALFGAARAQEGRL
ncbi:hypothetical protein [Janthinobacterium sp. GMG1]|uniref:hypothetical protein n=1 Tax=Janthinobacterium sp. GMG1 TaxID=3096007 RepID=UPI002ACAB076|nr:hypothetical protein [Janthinobacterium sp. GMG1]MDZ5633961.1 hypothetical protein [Janthinobacterium sp. GMG1]